MFPHDKLSGKSRNEKVKILRDLIDNFNFDPKMPDTWKGEDWLPGDIRGMLNRTISFCGGSDVQPRAKNNKLTFE